MPNLNQSQVDVLSTDLWGVRTDRATAALPASTHAPIFTITGGRVIVNMILGKVTTIIQTQTCNTKVTSYPTTGTNVDLCTVTDITALEVGGMLAVPAVASTALTKANAGAIICPAGAFVVPIGALHLDCGATNTGSIQWSCWWTPFDDGALLVAA